MKIKQIAEKIVTMLFMGSHGEKVRYLTCHESYGKYVGEWNEAQARGLVNRILESELPRWIPVAERLPEAAEQVNGVLIQFKCGKAVGTGLGKYLVDEWFGEIGNALTPDGIVVTHWQPLPLPEAYQPDAHPDGLCDSCEHCDEERAGAKMTI